jgi:ataxin-10
VKVDSISPLVREWALWGVRNMCEGNDAVQQAVLDLQPVSPVQSPELSQMGLQVQLDTSSGKFHLVSTEAKAGVCPG